MILCSSPAVAYRDEIDRCWIERYVLLRESHDPETREAASRMLALFNAPAIGGDEDYREGPAACRGAGAKAGRVEAAVTLVALIGEDTGLVRFATRHVLACSREPEPPRYWVATIGYAYGSPPPSAEDRLLNPWGFTVTSYLVAEETEATAQRRPRSLALGAEDRP